MTPSFRPQVWTGKLLKICRNLDAFAIGGFSKTKREQYDKDMYDEKRRNGELAAARDDGYAEGEAKGHAEGYAEGEAKAQMEIARKLLSLGTDIETVADVTGLDIDVIRGM